MCPPLTTCGGRLQRLFTDWIPAFAGMTNEACAGLATPDVMPDLFRHPVDKMSRRDTYN